ncbi:MAG: FAD-binding oxidoreductase [Planctomycetaceae bacterium]
MPTRREFLKKTGQLSGALVLSGHAFDVRAVEPAGVEVNDVQSQLNATRVNRIVQPTSIDAIQGALRSARGEMRAVSVAGGRHAMGGQQFGRDTLLLDMTRHNRVVLFDKTKGHIEVQAGIEWPELIDYLHREQLEAHQPWVIREKQTGVDRVSLGGSLASNVHGRGLRFPPIVGDVESFVLIDARGMLHSCSRRENAELFALAIGGYGLFGIIAQVTLRLVPRTKVQRIVEVIPLKNLLGGVENRLRDGFMYGDCQYSTDLEGDADSHPGVFACYRPVAADTPVPADQKQLSNKDWIELYTLARTNKKKAFERYSQYYLGTSGQVYWSDTHQLAGNFDAYREAVDKQRGTEMITEVYVTKDAFLPLLAQARKDFLEHRVDMTYGTIRFIEKDTDTFLAWAKEPSVCIVCNLHVLHTEEGQKKAAADFRRIIDRVIQHGGRYYLTYHRWADRKQVGTCYPQFVEFLRLKRKYDPDERFQSDWYRHYKKMFADKL